MHGGANYLLKMAIDCNFLPAPFQQVGIRRKLSPGANAHRPIAPVSPEVVHAVSYPLNIAQDPLLLSWFSEGVQWITDDNARAMPDVAPNVQIASDFGVKRGEARRMSLQPETPRADSPRKASILGLPPSSHTAAWSLEDSDEPPPPSNRLLVEAQAMILRELRRCDTSGLQPHVSAGPAALDDGLSRSEVKRWRWAAYQLLLYGSECYGWLLGGFQRFNRWHQLNHAARLVQRRYRGRLTYRFAMLPAQILHAFRIQQVSITIVMLS